jgi:hypothetical protein
MAYAGTTAASSISNPPTLVSFAPLTRSSSLGSGSTSHAIGRSGGPQQWVYSNSTEGSTVTSAALYFTDAWQLGMRPGDIVHGSYHSSVGSTDRYAYRLIVTSVTTNGAVCSTIQMSTG